MTPYTSGILIGVGLIYFAGFLWTFLNRYDVRPSVAVGLGVLWPLTLILQIPKMIRNLIRNFPTWSADLWKEIKKYDK